MNLAKVRTAVLASMLFALSVSSSHAQTAVTGAITGYVSDSSGNAVPGATVEATEAATSVTTQSVSNNSGIYRFDSLLPGSYSITVSKPAFRQFVRQAIQVDAGMSVRIDAGLQVGATASTVVVTGGAPVLQTDSVQVTQTFQAQEISALPTFGRNITRLGLLVPGVSMPAGQLDLHPENAGESFNVNINGGQGGNFQILDGVDNTEPIQSLSLLVPTQDSVQEESFATSNYDAEYGKSSSGIVLVTTKSGTNNLHGSAFEYYRDGSWFAANPFTQPNGVPPNIWNQFGGSIGGAIRKDKLFFFTDYQGMQNHFGTSSLYTAPIAAFKNGNFSSIAATDPIYDPDTGNADGTGRTQFPGNQIPTNRLSPAAIKLLALLPDPTVPTATDNNYTVTLPAIFDQQQADGRIDYFVSPKTLIFGKFSYFHANFFTNNVFGATGGGPPLGGAANSGNSTDNVYSTMVNYQRTFSSTLQQDFRFAFSRILIQELQLDASQDTATAVGIPNVNLGTVYTSGLPGLTIDGPVGAFMMGDGGLPFFERETNFEFFDTWTKILGRHSVKFGADVEKFFGIRTDVSGRGAFDFSPNLTGNPDVPNSGSGMASFLLGLSDSFSRDVTLIQPQEKQWKLGFYGQDTWRVSPRLTAILGLRWDYYSPIFSQNGQSVGNLDLNTGDILLTNLAGKYAGVQTLKTEYSPRLGISYQLFRNTVLRGGFGRSYFLNSSGATFGTQGCCFPIKQSQAFVGENPYAALPFTLDQGPGKPAALPAFPSNGLIPLPNGYTEEFPGTGDYPHSYNNQWNVTLQQAFGDNVTISIGYVGSQGRHLWDNIDVNAPVPGPGDFNTRRPYYAKYGWTVEEFQRNDQLSGYPELTSNYNALQATFNSRIRGGLTLLSNFTWDKSLDEGVYGPQNQFNFASNYGNSSTTRPYTWISAATWAIPVGRGKLLGADFGRAADTLVGGWQLSGIVNFEAGQYFTPQLANSASLNSTITLRPNRDGSGTVPNPNRHLWFDPTAFSVPAPYTFGNSGNGILLGPRFFSTDLSVTKSIAITEKAHLDINWDIFNALNNTNLAAPNAFVDTSTAGQITGTVDFPRRMQIGAHLNF
jgi:Carboxypeptidase regulatory-like domain/TonB dependent receptor